MTHKKLEEIFFKEHSHGKLYDEEREQILYTEEGVKRIVKDILQKHLFDYNQERKDISESISEVDKMWK